MARCGCASNVCTCTIQGGTGVQVSGTGTPTDPYILGAQPSVITVADSASVDLTLTGNGTVDAPYLLRADLAASPGGSGSAPTGSVIDFAGNTAPGGWVLCNGAAIARVEFSALFAVIGTTYGVGDGSSTFNVPDTRGRIVMGAGSGAGLSPRTLAAKGGSQDSTLPTHTHTMGTDTPDHAHASSITDGAGAHQHATYLGDQAVGAVHTGSGSATVKEYSGSPAGDNTYGAGNHNHTVNNPGATARHSHSITGAGVTPTDQNLPPFIVLNQIIKT